MASPGKVVGGTAGLFLIGKTHQPAELGLQDVVECPLAHLCGLVCLLKPTQQCVQSASCVILLPQHATGPVRNEVSNQIGARAVKKELEPLERMPQTAGWLVQ